MSYFLLTFRFQFEVSLRALFRCFQLNVKEIGSERLL